MMTHKQFWRLLAGFGADLDRWPESQRDAAVALLGRSTEARQRLEHASRLDRVIEEAGMADDASSWEAGEMDATVARVRDNVAARIACMQPSRGSRRPWLGRADRFLRGLIIRPARPAGPFGWFGVTTGLGCATVAGLCIGWMQVVPPPPVGMLGALQFGPFPGLVF